MWTKLFPEFQICLDQELNSTVRHYDSLLSSEFEDSGAQFSRINGGTKSLLYLIDEKWVLKLPLQSSKSKSQLKFEVSVLEHLYNNKPFSLEGWETARKFSGIPFKRLESPILNPNQAFTLQRKFAILTPDSKELIDSNVHGRDISDLIRKGTEAADFFFLRNIVDSDFLKSFRLRVLNLEVWLDSQERVFCHGDFGPLNIYFDDNDFMALDWEDSFFGVQDYDFLYWLTFLNNMKLISKDTLLLCNMPIKIAVDFLFLIGILKEYSIYFSDKKYRAKMLTMERMEILSKLTENI
jgi:hypothetical protein